MITSFRCKAGTHPRGGRFRRPVDEDLEPAAVFILAKDVHRQRIEELVGEHNHWHAVWHLYTGTCSERAQEHIGKNTLARTDWQRIEELVGEHNHPHAVWHLHIGVYLTMKGFSLIPHIGVCVIYPSPPISHSPSLLIESLRCK